MEDFVNFEIAKKLKEKGFKEECLAYYHTDGELLYNKDQYRGGDLKSLLRSYNSLPKNPIGVEQIDAPTISQVLKWLREEKGIHVCIALGEFSDWMYDVSRVDGNMFCKAEDDFKSYEQAVLAGVNYCLENLI